MDLSVVILAAGVGKRMNSSLPKVLHKLAHASFLEIILTTLSKLNIKDIRIVASNDLYNHQEFKELDKKFNFKTFIQHDRLGTAHALQCAIDESINNSVLVLSGDTPLIKASTIKKFYKYFIDYKTDILVAGFNAKKPFGYGRLLVDDIQLKQIIEEKDADITHKKNTYCNGGVYLIDSKSLPLLTEINDSNVNKEFYLTDIIKIANDHNFKVSHFKIDSKELIGINNQLQKAQAYYILLKRLRNQVMKNGVCLIDPSSTHLAYDTKLSPGVIVHPFVVFGRNVNIKEDCEIYSFSHLEGVDIAKNCKIGPFARIRPKTIIGSNSKIGNFVEIKSAKISSNVKASHLSYIGDADIEENVNIGAGTIFCNYDGYSKNQTFIGKDSFIGSNTALVAPLRIGSGAIVGAGSVITEDIEDNALSLGRARQVNFKQKAELIRKKKSGLNE